MKPINEKERTFAFVQFLILFILTVLLTIFFVFFDVKMRGKEIEELKTSNKKLKENQITSSDLPTQIDSLRIVVTGFKKLSETDYKDESDRFIRELNFNWNTERGDSSQVDRIKNEMFKVFKEWTFNVGASIREEGKNSRIKNLEDEIKQWDKKYEDLKDDFNNYKASHL